MCGGERPQSMGGGHRLDHQAGFVGRGGEWAQENPVGVLTLWCFLHFPLGIQCSALIVECLHICAFASHSAQALMGRNGKALF